MTAKVEKPTKTEEDKATVSTTTETTKKQPPPPPLVVAIRRLDRLLKSSSSSSGSTDGSSTSAKTDADYWKNPPAKVVKRWLGTTSGTAQTATLDDVVQATKLVLDPTTMKGRELLLSSVGDGDGDDAMETTGTSPTSDDAPQPSYLSATSSREVEAWLLSCTIRLLWKEKKLDVAFRLAQESVALVEGYLSSSSSSNVGGLFPLLSRLYRYQSLVAGDDSSLTLALRPTLVKAHGTACQRRDVDTQATLINLLLHDLLNSSQVEQAYKLLSISTFPTDQNNSSGSASVPNNQLCRYLYYSGRIQALRLDYTSSFSSLSTCFRKSPTNTGFGFRLATQRLLIVVQLLMGEIPNRQQSFSNHEHKMKKELEPYLHITQAVRRGDLTNFGKVVSQHAIQFKKDQTFTLISRLEHVVVKAGLRQLQMAYSRIGLKDISTRLGLEQQHSVEFVVSKAIRDGVVEATIHHEGQYLESRDLQNIYSKTTDPQEAFHRRIVYCLTTHNDAIRGMRYPPDAYKKQLEASRGGDGKKNKDKNDSDDKTDEERARELEDEMDEDY